MILGSVAALVIVGAGSFYGGIAFQRSQQASAQARFFATRGGRPGADSVRRPWCIRDGEEH
jgi:hypothetical protein